MASIWPFIILMAKKSNSLTGRRLRVLLAISATIAACWPGSLPACPFCTALEPTLCQLREQAEVVALVEVVEQSPKLHTRLRLHKVLSGAEQLQGTAALTVDLDVSATPGSLLLIFGSPTGQPVSPAAKALEPAVKVLQWHAVAVNEREVGYLAKAPPLKTPEIERLRYFARFLEHADPLIAQDAYLEFGHATFRDVTRAADALPLDRMKDWLNSERVPAARKGFYGMVLGLAPRATERRANAAFLEKMILAPEDDFRAGFDGILGGYLLLRGADGLELIESRYLANPKAADGDVRHAIIALRFYEEFGREIPRERLAKALACVLARPEFAAMALTDLARWNDWGSLARVGRMYDDPAYSDPAIRRAIVGYLLACPKPAAATELARLRTSDPAGVAAAENILLRTSGLGAGKE
jgi:hypothetical protein